MVIASIPFIGLRAAAILGTSLGKGQTVQQVFASSSIFGLGYGVLTNIGYNVANEGITTHFRTDYRKSFKSKTFTLGMPYGSYGYNSRYRRSRYPRRYRSYYPRKYRRYF